MRPKLHDLVANAEANIKALEAEIARKTLELVRQRAAREVLLQPVHLKNGHSAHYKVRRQVVKKYRLGFYPWLSMRKRQFSRDTVARQFMRKTQS